MIYKLFLLNCSKDFEENVYMKQSLCSMLLKFTKTITLITSDWIQIPENQTNKIVVDNICLIVKINFIVHLKVSDI